MKTIIATEPFPFIDEKAIARFEIVPLSFAAFCKLAEEVAQSSDATDVTVNLSRARMLKQIVAYDSAGETHVLTALALATLPISYGKQLHAAVAELDAEPGEIINAGDGATSPITYKLGTPLKTATDVEIIELEFQAKLYGDIEAVLVAPSELQQALTFIKQCATPIMSESSNIKILPDWAIDGISLADGLFIMSAIMPDFLE